MELQGNKILITGASAGIGEALLLRFVSLGNSVIAVGRNTEKLERLADEHRTVIPFSCDISDSQELERLTAFIKTHHPDTNILINNAAVQYNYLFESEQFVLQKIDHEINTNLIAPLKLSSLSLPVLTKNKNAAIVNVSSGIGLVPKKQAPVYCATKAGIHIFSKSLRYQLQHVKVFEIIPSLVDTEMTFGRGKGKIKPSQLVDEFINAFSKNQFEINIGKVKLLRLLNRISPKLAENIMKKGGE